MSGVLSDIQEWAQGLAYWEQAALTGILSGQAITEVEHRQLLTYLLEDEGLRDKTADRPLLTWDTDKAAADDAQDVIRLLAVSKLEGVNALIPNQRIEFGPQLTAIYGGNGSGKSGYARVLGSGAFTRGDRLVLRDVTRPMEDSLRQCAKIEVNHGAGTREVEYEVGKGCPELRGFYMFDTTAVKAHMSDENTISFSPAGLTALPRLAEVTDQVRSLLSGEIAKRRRPNEFEPLFEGDSSIKKLIKGLGIKSDLTALGSLATLSPSEKQRIADVEQEIAEHRVRKIGEEIAETKQAIKDMETLLARIDAAEKGLSAPRLEAVAQAMDRLVAAQTALREIGVDQFKTVEFTEAGSDPWHRFIQAAKTLADAESSANVPYPQADSHCLLCHQPLSPEAMRLIERLWRFLEADAQDRITTAQTELDNLQAEMSKIDIDFFEPESVWYRLLQNRSQGFVDRIEYFVERCLAQRELAMTAAHSADLLAADALPAWGEVDVRQVVTSLEDQLVGLEAQDPAQSIVRLEQELRELQHRVVLGNHWDKIRGWVEDLLWAEKAEKTGGSTRHITRKHNELFDALVTQRYIQKFGKTLGALGRSMQVEVKTRGRKGETVKQIVVKAHASVEAKFAHPDKVLSEGEKRAVALADFLTEVALDNRSRGIILDDPVTSLDLEWRHVIAQMLAHEAARQQVIVFTHDMPFLYYLKNEAGDKGINSRYHWIKRGDEDDKPGYVFINNSPALEQDYKSSRYAQEAYERSRKASPTEQERCLKDGFGALRTCYEAFTITEGDCRWL